MTRPLILALLLFWLNVSLLFYGLKIHTYFIHPTAVLCAVFACTLLASILSIALFRRFHPTLVSEQIRVTQHKALQPLILSWVANMPIELHGVHLPTLHLYRSADVNGFTLQNLATKRLMISDNTLNNLSVDEMHIFFTYLYLQSQAKYMDFLQITEGAHAVWVKLPLAIIQKCVQPIFAITFTPEHQAHIYHICMDALKWLWQIILAGPALFILRMHQRKLIYQLDAKIARCYGQDRVQRFLKRTQAAEDLCDGYSTNINPFLFHQPAFKFALFATHPSLQNRVNALNAIGNLC